jgi:hydroxymethylglutaryl-CoA lyase
VSSRIATSAAAQHCERRQPGADITVCEAWLRDGIQGWAAIPAEGKLSLLRSVVAAGVREIDVTSFVPARYVPQFGDCEQIMAAVPGHVRARVLTVTTKGAQRVIDCHRRVRRVDLCGIPYSVSESHNKANLRRDHATHRAETAAMTSMLADAGIPVLLGVATAYGCPIEGRVATSDVIDTVEWAYQTGIRDIMFGDTTGMADPVSVRRLFGAAIERWPDVSFVAHFHDNRGCGIANVLAAIESGVTVVDASLGGVGGEPASVDQGFVGESGNVTSEDLVAVLAQMGFSTGIDRDALLAAGSLAEQILGRPLHSRVQRAGLVPFLPAREG